jgi:5-methylcytosine-specific restriction endonuclease McrA
MTEKLCKRCGKTQSLTEFYRDSKSISGYQYYCKTCYRVIGREQYHRNIHKYRAKSRRSARAWYLKNKMPKTRTRMSKEQQTLRNRIASRKHYYSHHEQEKLRIKVYRALNPDMVRLQEKRRRARKMGAIGSHTLREWEMLKKEYSYLCPFCQASEPEIRLTQDHIIPLSRGGGDDIDNIQPLCFSCNSSKQDKLIERVETYLFRWRNRDTRPEKRL